ncbi:MAG: RNA-binding protein [Alphaproteobacteria bacterium]
MDERPGGAPAEADPTVTDRGAAEDDRREPTRRCVVTRAVRPKAELLRFVVALDGTVVPDLGGDLPGRGVWVSARRAELERACKANMFARAARRAATVPEGLPDRVEQLLARRCVDLLGLARRAGQAVSGYEKVRDWLARDRAGLLIEAADGAADGRGKVTGAARTLPVRDRLTAAEIGAAFGRDRAVHVAVAPGGFARRLQDEMHRLAGFRPGGEGK